MGNETVISVKSDREYLAVLLDIELSAVTDADMIIY
jgi:hypothetical protein